MNKINFLKKVMVFFISLIAISFFTGGKSMEKLSKAEMNALKKPIYDYVEGWYDKDIDRMKKGIHPDLAKRSMESSDTNGVRKIDLEGLLSVVPQYGGTDGKERIIDIKILDVGKNIATAKVISNSYYDYVQLGYWKDQWWIINVLWEFK